MMMVQSLRACHNVPSKMVKEIDEFEGIVLK